MEKGEPWQKGFGWVSISLTKQVKTIYDMIMIPGIKKAPFYGGLSKNECL
jgi:hypothetical protein